VSMIEGGAEKKAKKEFGHRDLLASNRRGVETGKKVIFHSSVIKELKKTRIEGRLNFRQYCKGKR